MPDAPGLELIFAGINSDHPGAVLDTSYDREQAALVVHPDQIRNVLIWLRDSEDQGYTFLASVHGADYLPAEPRFAVHYELLNRGNYERLRVKALLAEPADGLPHIESVVDLFPTAEFQEREVYDFFGIVFDGHPDPRRILMPEDYEGHPQRRDFPIGGEPVIFTRDEVSNPGWWN